MQFTASAVDFSPTPGTWDWYWVHSGSSSIPVTACAGQQVCTYAPQQTGTMLVSVRESSTLPVKGISDSVEVLKCPTGDTLLDHPIIRTALRRALDSSYADSALSKRRERSGYIFRDTTSGTALHMQMQTVPITNYTLSTPCDAISAPGQGPPISPPYVLVAYYHTHPFSSGSSTAPADIKPSNCGPRHSGRAYQRGPSPPDWASALNLGPVDGYIIDKNEVSKFDATHPNATNPMRRSSLVQYWPWNTAACHW